MNTKKGGWVKIWEENDERRTLWTNAAVMFYDTEKFYQYPVGYYTIVGGTLVPVEEEKFIKIPKFDDDGYEEGILSYVGDTRIDVLVSLYKEPDLICIKSKNFKEGKEFEIHINYEYFAYIYPHIKNEYADETKALWQIKNTKTWMAPVLIFYQDKLKGAIMPVRMH